MNLETNEILAAVANKFNGEWFRNNPEIVIDIYLQLRFLLEIQKVFLLIDLIVQRKLNQEA